ncbi:ABC transporter permease [Candidatus Bipolaricaulota bacterium]|nr:ABC transporter permease [Candidatus Bipolaricaulota bacterium]
MKAALYILTLIAPGLGHMVIGRVGKGILFMTVLAGHAGTAYLAFQRGRFAWQPQPFAYKVSPTALWVSTICLLVVAAAVWVAALWDLRRSVQRQEASHVEAEGYWRLVSRRFSQDPKGLIGLAIISIVCYVAIFAPFLASTDATRMNLRAALVEPGPSHPLGTDNFGRDILDRIIFGARVDLGIGVVATVFNMMLGGLLGLVAGYYRKTPDAVIMRILEIVNAVPFLVLVLLAISLFGSSVGMMILVLGIFGLEPARIVRSEVLSVRENDYVMAARAMGAPTRRIIFRHVLPNSIASLIVVATMAIGVNIIVVAGLSFLGFGVKPPTPSWGSMLQEAQEFMRRAWWMAVFPGLSIVTTVFGFNILGDSLRDVLDPRLK